MGIGGLFIALCPVAAGMAKVVAGLSVFLGMAFLIQPMNWWWRYTLWIYALGLPCFVALATVLTVDGTEATLASGGRSWWAAARRPMVRVGGHRHDHHRRGRMDLLSLHSHRGVRLAVGTHARWRGLSLPLYSPMQQVLWPELTGSGFEQIFSGSDGVAISPLTSHPGTNHDLIIGGLVQVLGQRQIVSIHEPLTDEKVNGLLAQNVRYVIWDDHLPLPEPLGDRGFFIEKAPGFYLVRLAARQTAGKRAKPRRKTVMCLTTCLLPQAGETAFQRARDAAHVGRLRRQPASQR